MIKRNTKNIGQYVKINGHKDFNGRRGKVVGFRGDYDKNNPWVEVFVYSIGSVWPFPSSSLEKLKELEQ